ncbi:hypothetical protein GGI07_002196 [Coemansia sp. Benny D115]|nr:hypothetical protein GGI07_002196 [Coemansia sp. Benny D115]
MALPILIRTASRSLISSPNLRQYAVSSRSKMAAAANTRATSTFLVIVRDFTDVEALSRRMAAREHHLAEATKKRESQIILPTAGAILDSHENGKMIGSALFVNAESPEQVVQILADDPYTQGKAWDMGSVQIYPFRQATF